MKQSIIIIFRSKKFTVMLPLLLLSFVTLLATPPKVSAAAAKCYSNNQLTNKPEMLPEGVCNPGALQPAGFDVTGLPNPFPPDVCYYWGNSGSGRVVNCEDPQYKNADELGDNPLPPVSVKCYEGKPVNGKQTYTKVDCTAEYQKEVGSKLESDKCYLIEKDKDGKAINKSTTGCDSEAAKEAEAAATKLAQQGGTIHAGQATQCKVAKNPVIPTWYQYLPVGDNCAVKLDISGNPNQIWLIGLAIADMLLRLAGLITVFVIISGGYKYITSQFDPEGTKKAKDTVLNGLIGLVIVTLATAIVSLIGNTLK